MTKERHAAAGRVRLASAGHRGRHGGLPSCLEDFSNWPKAEGRISSEIIPNIRHTFVKNDSKTLVVDKMEL